MAQPRTQHVDPLTFLARQKAGRYSFAFSIGGQLKEGETVPTKQPFDPLSVFIVNRITCTSPETGSLQIIEGNDELLHAITEIKEYAANISEMFIQRLNLVKVVVTKIAKEAPVMVRLEGDLFPAGLID
jgi:hypothetical protein